MAERSERIARERRGLEALRIRLATGLVSARIYCSETEITFDVADGVDDKQIAVLPLGYTSPTASSATSSQGGH